MGAHLKAFALIMTLMIGGFAVFPYIATYLEKNMGMTKGELPLFYMTGGGLVLFAAPIIGRLADRYGKLPVIAASHPCRRC